MRVWCGIIQSLDKRSAMFSRPYKEDGPEAWAVMCDIKVELRNKQQAREKFDKFSFLGSIRFQIFLKLVSSHCPFKTRKKFHVKHLCFKLILKISKVILIFREITPLLLTRLITHFYGIALCKETSNVNVNISNENCNS